MAGSDPDPAYLPVYNGKLALIKKWLGAETYSRYYERGPHLGIEQILTYLAQFSRTGDRAGLAYPTGPVYFF